jgi:hypothetical protein
MYRFGKSRKDFPKTHQRNISAEENTSSSFFDIFTLVCTIWSSIWLFGNVPFEVLVSYGLKFAGVIYYSVLGTSFLKALMIWLSPILNVLRRIVIGIWFPVLIPQSGFTKVDPFIKEVVLIASLIELLRDARTKRARIAAVTMYLQSHSKESLFLFAFRKLTR